LKKGQQVARNKGVGKGNRFAEKRLDEIVPERSRIDVSPERRDKNKGNIIPGEH